MRRPALPLAVLVLLAIAAGAGTTGASPQPTPVCGFCATEFEAAAEAAGVNATVASSRVTVQVHDDGSATWTVRNALSDGAARFRRDPSLLVAAGRRLAGSVGGVVERARFVDARMAGDTAMMVFRDPTAAERHAGLVVVDYFHHDGYVPWYVVNADELTLRGPPGTVVANDPSSGSVDGRTVTWRGSSRRPLYEARQLDGESLVVFGPDGSLATDARTRAALFLAVWPLVLERASGFLLLQVPAFVVVLAGVAAATARLDPDVSVRALAGALAGLGVVGAALMLVGVVPRVLAALVAVPTVVALLAWDERPRGHLHTARRQAVVAAGCLVCTWGVVALLLRAMDAAEAPLRAALRLTAPAFPLAAMVPLGAALGGGRRRAGKWGVVTVLAFVAVPPSLVDFTGAYSGLGLGFVMMAFLAAAFVLPVVGAPLLVLGRRLAGGPAATDRGSEERREHV